MIKASAADKLQLNRPNDDLVLAEVKSNGERTVFKDHDVSIPTALYLNARIFVSSKDHIDALVSIPNHRNKNKIQNIVFSFSTSSPSRSGRFGFCKIEFRIQNFVCLSILFSLFIRNRHHYRSKKVLQKASNSTWKR